MPEPDLVLTHDQHDGRITTVTLNRPETRNATSIALLDALDDAVDRVAAEASTRVLILGGAGASFCSGLDLREVRADASEVHVLLQRLSRTLLRIRRLPLVTIARVHGAAVGGGLGFVAVTDLAVTHPEARIGYPPLEAGLNPAMTAPWLVRRIGPARARAMLLTGGTISGRRAYDAGIVTHLCDEVRLSDEVLEMATEIAAADRDGIRRLKRLLDDLDGPVSDDLLDRATRLSAEVITSEETQTRLRRRFPDP